MERNSNSKAPPKEKGDKEKDSLLLSLLSSSNTASKNTDSTSKSLASVLASSHSRKQQGQHRKDEGVYRCSKE